MLKFFVEKPNRYFWSCWSYF